MPRKRRYMTRKTPEEKQALVARYDAEMARGKLSAEEVCDKIGVSAVARIYEWKRALKSSPTNGHNGHSNGTAKERRAQGLPEDTGGFDRLQRLRAERRSLIDEEINWHEKRLEALRRQREDETT